MVWAADEDEPENLMLVYLRRLDQKMDRLTDTVGDQGRRLTSVEDRLSRVHAELASLHGDMAAQSLRMDRIDSRLDRIERRLDLREGVSPP